MLGGDVSVDALRASAATAARNGATLQPVQMDLLSAMRPGLIDVRRAAPKQSGPHCGPHPRVLPTLTQPTRANAAARPATLGHPHAVPRLQPIFALPPPSRPHPHPALTPIPPSPGRRAGPRLQPALRAHLRRGKWSTVSSKHSALSSKHSAVSSKHYPQACTYAARSCKTRSTPSTSAPLGPAGRAAAWCWTGATPNPQPAPAPASPRPLTLSRLLPRLGALLSPRGVFYLLGVKENAPAEIAELLAAQALHYAGLRGGGSTGLGGGSTG